MFAEMITWFLQKGVKAAQHFCNSYFLSSSVMHMIRCSFFLSIVCYFQCINYCVTIIFSCHIKSDKQTNLEKVSYVAIP
jgi:hypothetical protein